MAYVVVYLVLSISHLISASCSWSLQYPNGVLFQSFSVQWNSRKSRYQIYFTSNMDHAQPVRKTARKKKWVKKNGKCGRKNVVSCLKWIFFQVKHEANNIKKNGKRKKKKKIDKLIPANGFLTLVWQISFCFSFYQIAGAVQKITVPGRVFLFAALHWIH